MADFSGSGWTGFFSLSRSSEAEQPTGLRHFPQISRDKPAEPTAPQKDEPGVVSVYTRGSLVPSEAPASLEGPFGRSAANDNTPPPQPQQQTVKPHVERPPAPRLEMKGPVAAHAVASVRAEQTAMRNAAIQEAALKAYLRMNVNAGRARGLNNADEFRRGERKNRKRD